MLLTDLPHDVLAVIVTHLRNIEDFTNFTSTCRKLHAVLTETTTSNTILNLCDRSAPTFFSPHPHFLVAASSRRLSNVVLGNLALTSQLVVAFQGGIEGLYEFCLEHSGLTLAEIREWHLARFSTINPFSDKIDKMAGQQWYQTPNFWDGGVSEAFTIYTEADRAAMQILIYGELFASSMDAFLEPERQLPHFGPDVRLEYIKYCIPDWVCWGYPGFEVKPTGPYASNPDSRQWTRANAADQTALQHILHCGRWRRMWRAVLKQIGSDFWDEEAEEERVKNEQGWVTTRTRQAWTLQTTAQRRQLLWWNAAVQTGGLEGAAAVTTVDAAGHLAPKVRERLVRLRSKIEALSEEQLMNIGTVKVGTWPAQETISEVPDFGKEVGACMRTLWPGAG